MNRDRIVLAAMFGVLVALIVRVVVVKLKRKKGS
jgi:hypothetical protein